MNTIHELIARQALDRPDECFLTFNEQSLTFGELRDQVEVAAACLRSNGFEPGHRILIMMRNHPDHVILYLALAWIDCVSVEVSMHLKRSGVELMIEDADPHAIVVDHEFAEEMQAAKTHVQRSDIPIFVRDPAGNALEFKSFRDPSRLFARQDP